MTPLLLGHRGTPKLHRENTMAGFQAALDAGLDGVELDVRRCADGTLVVHHDVELWDGRAIPELTAAQLAPQPVPTLDEVLAWAADTGAYLNIEIKFERLVPDDRVAHTLDAIRQHGLIQQVILSSFNPLILDAARTHAPDIERGFLYHKKYVYAGFNAVPVIMRRIDAVALHPHFPLIDEQLMQLARAQGWRVNTWTVNDPVEVRRLTDLGVRTLIGDRPEVLLAARQPV